MLPISQDDEIKLLSIAHESVNFGLKYGESLKVDKQKYSATLQTNCGTFTTLRSDGELRGCCGSIEAILPLISAVTYSAYRSAFQDSRFPPLQSSELKGLTISISILSPTEELQFENEEDVMNQINPGVDGLVIEYMDLKGTLLPSVWESIPDKYQFFSMVKQKAGLPEEFWSEDIRVLRYTTHTIAE